MLNKYLLPEYLLNCVYAPFKPDPYRFGITALIDPPLIRSLKIKHWDELQEDIVDKIWLIRGLALDEYLKRHSRWGLTNIKLETIWTKDEAGNEITVVAKPDYYNILTKVLADFKDTSVWSIINDNVKWEQQLNSYNFLINLLVPQLEICQLQLHAFPKDWKVNEKLRIGADYPIIPMSIIDIPRWNGLTQHDFIDARLKDHLENPTRCCTAEERWEKPDCWAVKKKGNKTAKGGKLCKTETEAHQWVVAHSDKQWDIEFRAGKCGRCKKYCVVNKFCKFYKEK